MFANSSTSNLQEKFVREQVSTTAGMALTMDDFAMHHFTASPSSDLLTMLFPLPKAEFEIKVQRVEEPTKGGLLAAVGAWEDFEDIDRLIDEIYKARGKAVDREVDL